jgi:hypothetical protein
MYLSSLLEYKVLKELVIARMVTTTDRPKQLSYTATPNPSALFHKGNNNKYNKTSCKVSLSNSNHRNHHSTPVIPHGFVGLVAPAASIKYPRF